MEAKVYVGEVEWFNAERGFGFINWFIEGVRQTDMFVHFSDIDMDGFRQLKAGQKISFALGVNNDGKPKAINVQVLE
jgi:cold shock protein